MCVVFDSFAYSVEKNECSALDSSQMNESDGKNEWKREDTHARERERILDKNVYGIHAHNAQILYIPQNGNIK